MKVWVEKRGGHWQFWLMYDNGTEIAKSCQPHRTEAKAITAAQRIAEAFRTGDVKVVNQETGVMAADVAQWGD